MTGQADESVPVLIVGGSMVGLSTAAFLGWHGVRALAVERHGGTAIHPRAAHFHLRTLEVFRAVGLEPAVRTKSEEQYDSDGGISAIESLAGKEIAKYIPSLNAGVELVSPSRRLFLTQESLEPILREHALGQGAELRYGTELVDFEQSDDGVVATTRDVASGQERRIGASYMVACDGWRSPIRHKLGIGVEGHGLISNSITIYFRADCAEYVAGRTEGVFYVFNDVLRGFFRLDRGAQTGFLVVNTAGDTSLPEATNVAEGIITERAEELLRAAIGVPDIEVEVLDIAPWQAVADNATSFQSGRVLIAGDAAHTMPPNGGFGGNTGVQDAFNLSWKIAHVLGGHAGPELVDTYDLERQPIGQLTIEQAYTRYVLRTAPYLGTDHIQPIADDLSLEIGHRYRSAAVLPDGTEDDGLPYVDPRESRGLPGTRAPHLWIERDGERMSTLDLFRKQFALLTGADGGAWSEAARSAAGELKANLDLYALDEPGFPEAYGIAPSGAVLVRPDGYVAWRSADGAEASTEAMARILGSLLCLRSD
ncbi:MAG TPA: FAD-dependent monooxygenase [Thermoleophilaceae bacterium]|jgi:2-polyprenyl-6-methoxyphenol hydroxylase-like FAD-dependent oxidoreductase